MAPTTTAWARQRQLLQLTSSFQAKRYMMESGIGVRSLVVGDKTKCLSRPWSVLEGALLHRKGYLCLSGLSGMSGGYGTWDLGADEAGGARGGHGIGQGPQPAGIELGSSIMRATRYASSLFKLPRGLEARRGGMDGYIGLRRSVPETTTNRTSGREPSVTFWTLICDALVMLVKPSRLMFVAWLLLFSHQYNYSAS